MISDAKMTALERASLTLSDMYITINVCHGVDKTETLVHARGESRRNPLPYLKRAVAALEAEIAGYANCPAHREGPRP